MIRRSILTALVLALPAAALGAEKLAILAAGEPPTGPDGEIAELTYQFRAACRDRVPNVLDPSDMRARFLGRTSTASEAELDRAYGAALIVYQNGEFESSLRTLRVIVNDLEALPETDEGFFQWKRANVRLAIAAIAANEHREAEKALVSVLSVDPTMQLDADQFAPSFRRRFEEMRAKVRAMPRHKLTITAEGRQGAVYVNGKNMGTTPLTLALPVGVYRVGGGAGMLRVPSFRVDLEQEDQAVALDFALAESLRLNAGPGLALPPQSRPSGVIRAGAWLGVDKLIVVSRADEGQAQFMVGSIYDVLRGALLREGSVRMIAGGVPSSNLAALAAFLLTGQASREVKDLSREPQKKAAAAVAASADVPAQPKPAAQLAEPARTNGSPAEPSKTASAAAGEPARTAATPAQSAPQAPPAATTAPRGGQPPAVAAAKASTPGASTASTASVVPLVQGSAAPAAAASRSAQNPAAPVVAAKATKPDLEPHPAATPAETTKLADPLPVAPARRGSWRKPVAIGAGVLAVGLVGVAIQQNSAAARKYSDANDQLGPTRNFKDQTAQARYYSLRSDGNRARNNATIAAGAAAACAVTAVIVGWGAWRTPRDPGVGLKLEF